MNKEKKNKKKLIAILALALIGVMAGTYAYFNQTLTAENPFDTGKYDSEMTEDFKPSEGENWEPGAEVNKDISVQNTGTYPIIVRTKFDEKWTRKSTGTTKPDPYKVVKGETAYDSTTVYQKDAEDGLVAEDKSVVHKTLIETNWVKGGDGWYYYKTNLAPGASTGTFLDAVKLDENADMGTYGVKKYYTEAATAPPKTEAYLSTNTADAATKWVEYTGEVPEKAVHNFTKTTKVNAGYSDSDYVLTITTQTIQASSDAVTAAGFATPTGTSWSLK